MDRRELLIAGGVGLGAAAWVAATGHGAAAGSHGRRDGDKRASDDCAAPGDDENASTSSGDDDASAEEAEGASAQETKQPTPRLDTDAIQGNILGGFNKEHQHFVFFRLPATEAADRWLAGTVGMIATSTEVLGFNRVFRAAKKSRRTSKPKGTWANVAFTFTGLKRLGVPADELEAFPEDFQQGMRARAAIIGDVGDSGPDNWVGPLGSRRVHGVLMVASDDPDDLADEAQARIDDLVEAGGTVLFEQAGQARAEAPGHEHFGFRDGISQPGIRGLNQPRNPDEPNQGDPGQDLLWPGEFVIGYPTQISTPPDDGELNTEPGPVSTAGPEWTVNGSFLVFRRLRQDVHGFRTSVAAHAERLGMSADVLGAKIVGRYRSGAPLEHTEDQPEDVDSTLGDPSEADPTLLNPDRINNFEYGDDLAGLIVPRAAHIRKAYPRDEPTPEGGESQIQTHRVLRRGIPFGASLDEAAPADSPAGRDAAYPDDRGLLFLCYQASIERQFEFVQRRFADDVDFPNTGDGSDPVIAQSTPKGPFRIPGRSGAHVLIMRHFVTTTGGDYFFQPSLPALRLLSGGPASSGSES